MITTACQTPVSNVHPLSWRQLPSIPDAKGVAGCFAGVAHGSLLVAGGANFPEKALWEGGRKVWHDAVYALNQPEGQWTIAGRLPRPLGYGVAVTIPDGVLCIGGSDSERHYADAFLLALNGGKLSVKPMPSLPLPLANGAGALAGQTVLVCGGSDQPGEKTAHNRLISLDLSNLSAGWRELEPCPGQPRLLSVAAALDGAFYLAGGAGLTETNGKVARVYLRDTWRYELGKGWQQMADLPKPAVAAPSPAPAIGNRFYILGGDDGSRVGFQPIEQHPGFPKTILAYDAKANAWSEAGEVPASRATTPTVQWDKLFVIPSGEARPGVRSPEVWGFEIAHP